MTSGSPNAHDCACGSAGTGDQECGWPVWDATSVVDEYGDDAVLEWLKYENAPYLTRVPPTCSALDAVVATTR